MQTWFVVSLEKVSTKEINNLLNNNYYNLVLLYTILLYICLHLYAILNSNVKISNVIKSYHDHSLIAINKHSKMETPPEIV